MFFHEKGAEWVGSAVTDFSKKLEES
jgi:hypothetical protein